MKSLQANKGSVFHFKLSFFITSIQFQLYHFTREYSISFISFYSKRQYYVFTFFNQRPQYTPLPLSVFIIRQTMVHTLTPTLSFPLCSAFFPRLFGDRTGICISNLLEKCYQVTIGPTNNFSGFVQKLDLIFYCTRFSSKGRIQDIIKTNETFRTLNFSCHTKQNLFTRPRPRSEDHY